MLQLEFGCPALSTIGMHARDLTGNLNLCLAHCFPEGPSHPASPLNIGHPGQISLLLA